MERHTILLKKYLDKTLTVEEFEELMNWASSSPHYKALLEDLSADVEIDQLLLPENTTHKPARKKSFIKKPYRFKNLQRYAIGLAACLLVAVIFNIIHKNKITSQTNPSIDRINLNAAVPIKTGTAAAHLLIPGKGPLKLTHTKGITMTQSGIWSDQGEALYHFELATIPPNMVIEVPKGAEFYIKLPDESKVWLNAESKLSFPSGYGHFERLVTLEGEGYFDINHLEDRPFVVHTLLQKIRVLGTSFNVKAYPQEGVTTTTLVEGKVEIEEMKDRSVLTLSPGESLKTHVGQKQITLKKVTNMDTHIAWQRGEFLFDQTPFEEVAHQIARWYNIDLHVETTFPNEYFSGQISRDTDFMDILEFFKQSGIQCELLGNVLIIK